MNNFNGSMNSEVNGSLSAAKAHEHTCRIEFGKPVDYQDRRRTLLEFADGSKVYWITQFSNSVLSVLAYY